jgi:phosphoribosylamine--glycine ligase
MRQVLIAAIRISASFLAKKIAEDNPNIAVHLLGPRIKGALPKNFSWIGEEITDLDLVKKIIKIHSSYDFIYANEVTLQGISEFQTWKKTCSVPVFCSEKEISHLEYSKLSAKKMLTKLNIPNVDYEEIILDDWGRVIDFKNDHFKKNKFVLKMNQSYVSTGFQTLFSDYDTYKNQISIFNGYTGNFFVEKFIIGKEFSAHFLCNGSDFVYLGSARDYKKQYENDEGPNTGSTGCYSPVEYVDSFIESQIFEYVDKILKYTKEHGIEYRGIMYLGCLIDSNNIVNILEINTRFGNPEFCAISNTISSNLLDILCAATTGDKLSPISFNDNSAVCIHLLHKKYSPFPQTFSKPAQLVEDKQFTVALYNPMLARYNYFACVNKVSDTVENAATAIVNYLDQYDLGDYTFRRDIGKRNV